MKKLLDIIEGINIRGLLFGLLTIALIPIAIHYRHTDVLLGVAVTVNLRHTNFSGGRKHRTFDIDGDTAQTLNTRMRKIDFVGFDTTVISAVAISAGTITFTASGAFTGVKVLVIGF